MPKYMKRMYDQRECKKRERNMDNQVLNEKSKKHENLKI